jgi:hypothetical protein
MQDALAHVIASEEGGFYLPIHVNFYPQFVSRQREKGNVEINDEKTS